MVTLFFSAYFMVNFFIAGMFHSDMKIEYTKEGKDGSRAVNRLCTVFIILFGLPVMGWLWAKDYIVETIKYRRLLRKYKLNNKKIANLTKKEK